MLFNSHEFILLFLPICFVLFFALSNIHRRISISFLILASLFFYGWWKVEYLALIILSIACNYAFAKAISKWLTLSKFKSKLLLTCGVSANLLLLGYYKYANFFVSQVNVLLVDDIYFSKIILPLAISFFTFQQIAYLVDSYRKEIEHHSFLEYCLFVTFFPQLIAGPIVHHKEMLPQFFNESSFKPNANHISIGLTLFSIGLFKKVALADNVAVYATPVFSAANGGITMSVALAWQGVCAYTLQLYFDFSGYSDMALGLARLFGIKLPENFNSPYKSTSIVEFWRRWHITLSRFLRDYLYIPLGGSRTGKSRRYLNLMLTMVLGGLWHGAGWNFIIWGFLHGSYLVINHFYTAIRIKLSSAPPSTVEKLFYWLLTIFAVIVAWVFFRAETLDGALHLLKSMFGFLEVHGSQPKSNYYAWWLITMLFCIAFLFPNSNQIITWVENVVLCTTAKRRYLSVSVSAFFAAQFFISFGLISELSEFLYFNF
ncbi:MBOAT family O-acyltransferase [Aliiglaciecola litoralis]|uniref:MBOAT family O-acyltransferase n=1 Tax=Aliiglaciecola litoralis TaxID=582857 RepID=UPI0031E0E349